MTRRVAVAAACAAAALVSAASAGSQAQVDGGSGTYFTQGSTYYFVLTNSGTAAWQFLYLVGPPGTTFIGGANTAEATAHCTPGQPDGFPNELECGPMSASVAPAHLQMTLAATLAAPVACGATFQLAVSSTGTLPFTPGDAVTESRSCTGTAPAALTPPALHGTPAVGHTLTATPPRWSATPTRVTYHWQRCASGICSSIANATRLTLRLTRPDAGRSVRVVATALVDGTTVESSSKKLAVRARR